MKTKYKLFDLIEFRSCNGGCGDPNCNEDRETILFTGIEPLCKLEANKIICEESDLIKNPLVIAVSLLPDWKRFDIHFMLLNGVKGTRKFKCVELERGQ